MLAVNYISRRKASPTTSPGTHPHRGVEPGHWRPASCYPGEVGWASWNSNAKDGKNITIGTGWIGTTPWIVAEYFFKEVGKVTAVHVPFAGGGRAIAAAIGNHVDVFAGNVATAAPLISQGQLRGIVVGSPARSPLTRTCRPSPKSAIRASARSTGSGCCAPEDAGCVGREAQCRDQRRAQEPDCSVISRPAASTIIVTTPDQAAAMFKSDIANWAKMSRAIGYQPD